MPIKFSLGVTVLTNECKCHAVWLSYLSGGLYYKVKTKFEVRWQYKIHILKLLVSIINEVVMDLKC